MGFIRSVPVVDVEVRVPIVEPCSADVFVSIMIFASKGCLSSLEYSNNIANRLKYSMIKSDWSLEGLRCTGSQDSLADICGKCNLVTGHRC